MGSDHDHGVGVAHRSSHRTRLIIALAITASILVAEVIGSVLTGSLALLVDAGHMLTDTAGLTMAVAAAQLSRRPATPRRTWGWRRAEILAALAQASILLAVGVYALVEGVQRLLTPHAVSSSGLLLFGVVGLAGNIVAMLVLSGGRQDNLNMRAAFLEVLNDALGSVAVIVSALVIAGTGWTRVDAVAGMLISLLIVPRSVIILRKAGRVLLESTPEGLDLEDVRRHILELPHVLEVHDLHASSVDSSLPVLTAHVVLDDSCFVDGHAPQMLDALQDCVAEHFPVRIKHSTFQLEPASHSAHEPERHR